MRALYWREREPERAERWLREPPWHDAIPWRDPDVAAEKLKATLGVDFWAAPDRWRLESYYLWVPDGASGIPSSRPLAFALAALTAAAAVPIGRSLLAPGFARR